MARQEGSSLLWLLACSVQTMLNRTVTFETSMTDTVHQDPVNCILQVNSIQQQPTAAPGLPKVAVLGEKPFAK